MWQIHTTSGNVEKVFGERSDLIALNFNKSTNQELCLHVKCLVINAISYDVFIGQETLFLAGFTINN
jgi:hypothetical protein